MPSIQAGLVSSIQHRRAVGEYHRILFLDLFKWTTELVQNGQTKWDSRSISFFYASWLWFSIRANAFTYIQEPSSPVSQRRLVFNFICVPVSPGNSRLIWASARNFGVWIDRIVPRWMFHLGQNLLLDSDLYLLHLEVASTVNRIGSFWLNLIIFPYFWFLVTGSTQKDVTNQNTLQSSQSCHSVTQLDTQRKTFYCLQQQLHTPVFSSQERKIMDTGPSNWQKACFVPTKSDAQVVGFRSWLIKHAGGQVDWGAKFSGTLPPSPSREQLLDR